MKLWSRTLRNTEPATAEPVVLSARDQRDIWLKWLTDGGKRERTIYGYRRLTDRFLDLYPDIPLVEINDFQIQSFIEEATPKSRQQRRSPFANWFAWAYRTKRIPQNPMDFVPAYKVPPRAPADVFSEEECRRLCGLPHPDGTLMAFLLGTGLRKTEAIMATVRRFDLENAELHVVEGAKGGHSRVVPLSAALVQRLATYFLLEEIEGGDFLWPIRPGGGSVIKHDRPITGSSFHVWFGDCLFEARVPYRNPHTTRHTYATAWRRKGLVMDDVAVLLGHADIKTTKAVYDHTTSFEVRKRMEALEETFSG